MERKQCVWGSSSLSLSRVGLGCNNFGSRVPLEEAHKVIHGALDRGINFLDMADLYGDGLSEEIIGKVLGVRRKEVVLATKFGGVPKFRKKLPGGWGAKKYIQESLEKSLKRLQTDWIDLYQMHFPDPQTPIEETLETLNEFVKQGKVRAIGNSNFTGEMIGEAENVAHSRQYARFDMAQNEWSLLNRSLEKDVVPACKKYKLGILPYFPLASGFLTGKYKRGQGFDPNTRLGAFERFRSWATDENFNKIEKLENFARECGHSLLELAFSWLAFQEPVISVIAGATTVDQVEANSSAINWTFSREEEEQIESILR